MRKDSFAGQSFRAPQQLPNGAPTHRPIGPQSSLLKVLEQNPRVNRLPKCRSKNYLTLPKIAGRLAADPEWAKFTDGNVSLFKGWIDQDVIPELPVDALRKGRLPEKWTFIVGSTSSEWRYYIVPNGAIAKKTVHSAAALIAGANRPETALEAYARVNRGKTWGDCFAQIQSDLIFRMPCVKLAESLAAGGAQVWTYDFAWESPVKGKSGASHRRRPHRGCSVCLPKPVRSSSGADHRREAAASSCTGNAQRLADIRENRLRTLDTFLTRYSQSHAF